MFVFPGIFDRVTPCHKKKASHVITTKIGHEGLDVPGLEPHRLQVVVPEFFGCDEGKRGHWVK